MKLAAKRGLYALLVLGGLALAGYLIYTTCLRPFLHLDLSGFGQRQGILLALTVLLLIAAGYAATYIFYHADLPILRMLLPLLICLVCLLGSALLGRAAAKELLCTYTDRVADYHADAEETGPLAGVENFYLPAEDATPVAYAYYEKNGAAGEEITIEYDDDTFLAEQQRIDRLPLASSEEDGVLTYLSGTEGQLTRLIVDPRARTVCYGRYVQNDLLPDFAPHVPVGTEAPEEEETSLRRAG